jgi:hypothetical protein
MNTRLSPVLNIKRRSLQGFALAMSVYLVARCAWDWKKLSHSDHPVEDFGGIVLQGLVATVMIFYFRRSRSN